MKTWSCAVFLHYICSCSSWMKQPTETTTKTPAAPTSSLLYIQRNGSEIPPITLNWRGAFAFVGPSGCTNGREDVLDTESGHHHKHSAQCCGENIFTIYEA